MSIKPYLCKYCDETNPDNFYHYINKKGLLFISKSECNACKKAHTKARKRNGNLQAKFNLTHSQYIDLLKEQEFVCKCCKEPWNNPRRHWPVDHDWKCCPSKITCGKCIRGIICMDCNIMLGHAKDEMYRLNAGIKYLGNWEVRQHAGNSAETGPVS